MKRLRRRIAEMLGIKHPQPLRCIRNRLTYEVIKAESKGATLEDILRLVSGEVASIPMPQEIRRSPQSPGGRLQGWWTR